MENEAEEDKKHGFNMIKHNLITEDAEHRVEWRMYVHGAWLLTREIHVYTEEERELILLTTNETALQQ